MAKSSFWAASTIRSRSIEVGEIEALVRQHPNVQDAVVAVQEDNKGHKRLVGYVIPAEAETENSSAFDRNALRSFATAELPGYMVPSIFIQIDAVPMTPNGKIDHKALPPVADDQWLAGTEYVAPATETEQAMTQLWADVLEIDPAKVGIHHNFFEIGGHSLAAVQIASRIRTEFTIELPMQDLLQNATVAQAAATVDEIQSRLDALRPTEESFDDEHEIFEL